MTSSRYADDEKAFLFRGRSVETTEPEQFKPNGIGGEVYNHPSYGPTFGKKFDFFTFDNSGAEGLFRDTQGLHDLRPPQPSYSFAAPLVNSACAKTDRVFQLEVLQVSEFDPAQGECEEPWLPGISWTDKVSAAHVVLLTPFVLPPNMMY